MTRFEKMLGYSYGKRFVTLLPIGSGYFRAKLFPVWIPQHFSNLVILHLPAYEEGTDSVFRNVGI
jgi:hypothetical protein